MQKKNVLFNSSQKKNLKPRIFLLTYIKKRERKKIARNSISIKFIPRFTMLPDKFILTMTYTHIIIFNSFYALKFENHMLPHQSFLKAQYINS